MAAGNEFVDLERAGAAAWKQASSTVPECAKGPAPFVSDRGTIAKGPFPFCLPPEHSAISLLPEVRTMALSMFAALGIPWHEGIDGRPGNHLLSSQVQCVNALGQMVSDPERLVRAFGESLGTSDVLEIENGRFLTFEYIGPVDYFNEGFGKPRVRGSMCTSVDAAFLHHTTEGVRELVLVEWKYTESYRKRTPDPKKDETRRARYEAATLDPDGPIHGDMLVFTDLLDEPIYQLMRQQLLAHALERDPELDVERVRIVHVSPAANVGYQRSVHRKSQRALGDSVSEIWSKLLRRPDRFVSLDSSLFLDPNITSDDYAARYGGTHDPNAMEPE